MDKIKELLALNPQSQAVVNYAKRKGVLYFSPQCVEIQFPEKDAQYPVAHREGFYAEDITGFWMPGDIITYIKANIENYKKGLEFGPWRALKFLSLTLPWSGWVWVVDSTETIRSDLVDDFIRAKPRQNQQQYYSQYESLCKAITEEEIYAHLNKNYLKIKEHFWVATNDPSVMVYDPKAKPYALKHGWSTKQIGEILSEWLEAVSGEKIPAKYKEGSW